MFKAIKIHKLIEQLKQSTFSKLVVHVFNENSRNQLEKVNKFKLPIAYLLISSLVINILSLMLPIMTLHTYDRIIPNKSYETMVVLLVVVFLALILETILKLVRSYLLGWAGAIYEHITTMNAIQKLLNAKQDDVRTHSSGEYIQGLSVIPKLREFYSGQALIVLTDLPFLLVYLFLIAYIGKFLVLVPLILMGVFMAYIWQQSHVIMKDTKEREIASTHRVDFIIEMLTGIHTVKSFGIENLFLRRADRLQNSLTSMNYILAVANGKTLNFIMVMSQLMTVGVAGLGAVLVVKGSIGMGALAACILLAGRVMQPIQRSVTFIHKIHDFEISQEKLNTIFNLQTPEKTQENVKILPQSQLIVQDMGFKFENAEKPLLTKVNLELQNNGIIAIKGNQNAGTTTLFNLIAGTLSPTHGTITLNGIDPRKIPTPIYPQLIGYIPSKNTIFQGTIRENLTFFGAIPDEQALDVAKKLGIDKAISFLPLGYETLLFDTFSDAISPGLKQRISIARVLALNPKIILFDQADTSLDIHAVQALIQYLLVLKEHSLIIVSTQNQKFLDIYDQVYTLKNGSLHKEKGGEHV